MKRSLVFVYNADSGLFNTLTDIAHKIFSPESYQCNLCAITYGTFAVRGEWKAFLETLPCDLEFLHRDEFMARYPQASNTLPAVFLRDGDGLEMMISAEEINACPSIAELKQLIISRLD